MFEMKHELQSFGKDNSFQRDEIHWDFPIFANESKNVFPACASLFWQHVSAANSKI